MTLLRLALPMSLLATLAVAQTVQVQAGGTAVNVQTGTGGASVDVKQGGRRTTVTATTGAGSATVQVGTSVAAPPPAPAPAPRLAPAVAPRPVPMRVESPASSEPYELNGAGQTELHTCGPGQTVEVNGSGHTLTLSGPCHSVTVNGSGHTVTIEMAGSIEVNGTDNNVIYRSGLGGRPAKISRSGVDNTVVQTVQQ